VNWVFLDTCKVELVAFTHVGDLALKLLFLLIISLRRLVLFHKLTHVSIVGKTLFFDPISEHDNCSGTFHLALRDFIYTDWCCCLESFLAEHTFAFCLKMFLLVLSIIHFDLELIRFGGRNRFQSDQFCTTNSSVSLRHIKSNRLRRLSLSKLNGPDSLNLVIVKDLQGDRRLLDQCAVDVRNVELGFVSFTDLLHFFFDFLSVEHFSSLYTILQ